jgi:phytoene dehydrogenase-like protein
LGEPGAEARTGKRAFRGLRLRQGPDERYDAVVIGAGIGGLICANLLARDGLRTLLVEQHYMVGGYCSTFRRKGFTFDAASHFYPLLGNPDSITGRLLGELGVRTRWVKMDPVDHFRFPDGSRFSVPADFDTYLERLRTEFPEEREGLRRFFAEVEETYRLGLLYFFRGRNTRKLDRYRDMTLREALDRHFTNAKLKLLLTADGPHWGAPPCRTSFIFDSMLRLSYFLGNYYPVGGSQAFADELAHRFEEQGGHVLMNTPVTRILAEDGSVHGIEVETGPKRNRSRKRVHADVVVSNADLLQTLEEMLGPEHVGEDYLQPIRQMRPTYPCFLTHIGLRGVSTELLREIQGYYWNDWDPDLLARNGLKFKIFIPTLFEPAMAPPGDHVMILQKVVDPDYYGVADGASHKAEIEGYILENLEAVAPGLLKHAVVTMSASAQTSYRFTRNHRGAMLGWEMSPDQLGDRRVSIVGPLKNLYFTGHWTQPGGGITPVIVSAMQVATAVARGRDRVLSPTMASA